MARLRNNDDHALIDFTRALVRLRSVLGDEGAVADCVAREMRRLLFDQVEVDAVGNAVGVIRGLHDGPTILFDAHMDTVDVLPAEAWKHDPFGAELSKDRIWGRGASDMKGPLAAMVHAGAALERRDLGGRAVISASVGEESIEGAALRAVMERYEPDFVVIGEASDLNLVRAGRGRAEYTIEAFGKPAHASNPAAGVNAVHRMRDLIAEIEQIAMPEHPFAGRGVMCLTDIISTPYPAQSVVPSSCTVTYERRLLPGEKRERVEAEILAACARAHATDTVVQLAQTDYRSYTGTRWVEPKWFPPWELPEDHALVQRSLAALRAAGLAPQLASYQFCTNAAHSAGVAQVPTIGFGPSTERHAHVIDEYLEVSQLLAARDGYAAIARAMLPAPG